jgi:hypothetical protein
MDIRLKESIVKQLEIELQTSLQIAEQYNIIITIYNEKPIVIEKKAILGSNVIRFIKNNIDKIDNINNTGHSILLFNKSNNANSVFLYCLIPNNELNNIIKEINTLNNKKIDYGRLTFSKKCTDLLLIDEMKAVRTACKEGIAKKLSAFSDSAEQVIADLQASSAALETSN